MNIEDPLKRHLARYLKEARRDSINSPSYVQRLLGIGYNMALHTIQYGVDSGALVLDDEASFRHHIADTSDYSSCLKCGDPVQVYGSRWCAGCHYPGIDEDYQAFIDLIEEGHHRHFAAVLSGWLGAEEI